jgi:2-dehydropantoate 2-reductase
MQIAIVGIGAMGCLFAGRLTPLADVVMLGTWGDQLDALHQHGLRVRRPDGSETICSVRATDNLAEVEPVDLVLILVKSHKTDRAAEIAAEILKPSGLALTLQNGLGNVEKLVASVGWDRSALGVTAQGATMVAPGVVREGGPGLTHLATRPGTWERLQNVATLFQTAALETHLVENAISLIWGKLAVNAGINPLTALLRLPNGFLADNEVARHIMGQAAEETAAVAHAQGIEMPYPSAAGRALQVARATATNHSSMLQDVLRDAPTEVEAITGEITRLGRQYHIPTPINDQLLALMHAGRHVEIEELNALFSFAPSEVEGDTD